MESSITLLQCSSAHPTAQGSRQERGPAHYLRHVFKAAQRAQQLADDLPGLRDQGLGAGLLAGKPDVLLRGEVLDHPH